MVRPDLIETMSMEKVIRNWDEWKQVGDSGSEAIGKLRTWAMRWTGATGIDGKVDVLIDFLSWIDIPDQLGHRYKNNGGMFSIQALQSELQALEKIYLVLDELKTGAGLFHADEREHTNRWFSDLLRLAMQEIKVNLSVRVPTGVQVVTPETASGMKFDSVFVIGLTEGIFPRIQHESWLLSDEERGLLNEAGVLLSRSKSRQGVEDLNFDNRSSRKLS